MRSAPNALALPPSVLATLPLVALPLVVLAAPGLLGCESSGVGLRVTVRTDLVPGVEIASAEAEIEGRPRESVALSTESGTFDPGVLVADFARLPPRAERELSVRLLDETGAVVSERPLLIAHRRALSLVIVMSRDCVGVACGAGADPEATACLAGQCVPPSCVNGFNSDGDLCAAGAECELAADCPPMAGCSEISCVEGVCFYDHEGGEACEAGQSCHPENGCTGGPPPDAGL